MPIRSSWEPARENGKSSKGGCPGSVFSLLPAHSRDGSFRYKGRGWRLALTTRQHFGQFRRAGGQQCPGRFTLLIILLTKMFQAFDNLREPGLYFIRWGFEHIARREKRVFVHLGTTAAEQQCS